MFKARERSHLGACRSSGMGQIEEHQMVRGDASTGAPSKEEKLG
eukprot:CAMPEP_0204569350 /NCGR_PEP_ID=MMETSP0661-20131031/37699_1 /ASSEMBLY_ACC=CAM_ASM_000606 /TAXON_ID=109239 /ORGANISM="Alexandrium margalefi, Strain AMGDE01CS-322" /LENGTH=43 /DNA_ID= /DNA_START= /DNA_END= /DNA_ORIENTATION=